jgi:FdhE protein
MAVTSDHIRKAVAAIKKLRPAYTDILEFYQQIFVAQEDSESKIQIDPIQIADGILNVKAEKKLPLINISEFMIDTEASSVLLRKICRIAYLANRKMAVSAKVIINALETRDLDPKTLFYSLLEEDDAFFEKAHSDLKIGKRVLAFVAYSSIKPSLVRRAEQLSACLDKDRPWGKGYCPICGNVPGLSMFKSEGERFLICSFCWHKWPYLRMHCPFCENNDTRTIDYFYSEEEREYRIDVCHKCNKYIKTVDTRKTERVLYLPLEQISTLHLDIKAKEIGLEPWPLNPDTQQVADV